MIYKNVLQVQILWGSVRGNNTRK